ncbi:autotransporter-associated N-terminal domain-containing protein, partial [Sebaldella sp. S0638]|uniref:autotransporter-associated N-terminal domain-containing protein n=1 Tax=Sebaldella sp. S0638 TaxID=2957809 RepID=UPI00209FAA21
MKNILGYTERQLKSCLKRNKRVKFSKSLPLIFLMTGKILSANENPDMGKVAENLQKKITKLRNENKKNLKYSRLELERLEKEGDQVIKSPWESYIFSTLFGYKDMDGQSKEWKYGDRKDTVQDIDRAVLRSFFGLSSLRSGGTTGWITETNTGDGNGNAWTVNTSVYDNTAQFTIIPTIKVSEVTTPLSPQVDLPSINVPVVPGAPAITLTPVNIGTISISVAAPTITGAVPAVTLNSPNDVSISTISPNINVSVDEVSGPVISTVNQPVISFTPPNLSVAPQVPPKIKVPTPTVTAPVSPPAPSFEAFTRGRGDWLGGFSFIVGRNNFDRKILAWEQGSPAPSQRGINSQPMFNIGGTIRGHGKNTTSKIYAVTDSLGVVNNRYTDIQLSNAAAGGKPTNQYGAIPYPTVVVSPAAFPSNVANEWVSAVDNDALQGFSTSRYQQSWIFQGSPIVEDMDIIVGGSQSYSTALFAQTGSIQMNRVGIELKGRTIIGQLSIRSAYNVKFTNVDINITGDSNSLLTTQVYPNAHLYWQSNDGRNGTTWGASYLDNTASSTAVDFGGTKLVADRSKNTIFYVAPSEMHRWLGYSQMVPLPGTTDPKVYDINSEKYYMFAPVMGNVNVKNTGGDVEYTGSGNVGIWVAGYVPDRTQWATGLKPSLDLGTVKLQGDKNVGFYLASHNTRPDANGIFQGNINVNVKLGTDIDGKGGTAQTGTGNISGNSNTKSEDNVALYVSSGQRAGMNNTVNTAYQEYFPATLDFKIDKSVTPNLVGINNNTQIGYQYLTSDPIKDLSVTNFNLEFGKFSERGIGIIAKNGSVVNVNKGSAILDNAGTGTDRATGTIMFYTEGVWFNPRKALTGGVYNKEAYGRGESQTGQKNIVDFNSTINVSNDVSMSSYEAISFFAKNGGKITGKNVSMTGHSSIGAFAYGANDLAAGSTVLANNTGAGSQASTTITLGNVSATGLGSAANKNDGSNSNVGIAALSMSNDELTKGTGSVLVTATGNLTVNGVGAFAKGDKAVIKVQGTNSVINTGENGGLVAQKGGKVEFGGGTITHKIDDKVAFYSDAKAGTTVSTIDFKGATTFEMYKGIAFYGSKDDFNGTSGRYLGMNNVTVNLRDNGINLGYFQYNSSESDTDRTINWTGSNISTYLNSLKTRVGNATINDNGFWFKSSLDGAIVNINGDVNLDYASDDLGGTPDKFNDITIERSKVIVSSGVTAESIDKGNGLKMASNTSAASNSETGYTIRGTVDIKDPTVTGSGAKENVGVYVSFGHINNTNTGLIKVDKGVGAYGVNGSQIINDGIVEVSTKTNNGLGGIGLVGVTRKVKADGTVDTAENYGTDNTSNPAMASLPLVDIINRGTLNIYSAGTTPASNATGIFAENNTGGARSRVKIYNEGNAIILGNESVGIKVKAAAGITEGGTLTLKHKTGVSGPDIKVGETSFVISADYSDVKFDGNYTVEMGRESVALNLSGNSTVSTAGASDVLTVNYDYNDLGITTAPKYGTGIYYTGKVGEIVTNNLNLVLQAAGAISDDNNALVGIYAAGTETNASNITKLYNNGNISVGNYDYGIYGKNIYTINTGNIEVKDNGIGILSDEGRVETADNKIKVTGDNGIGIYAGALNGTYNRDVLITSSGVSNKLEVTGEEGIGVYLEGKARLDNRGIIELADSNTPGALPGEILRKTGVYLKNSDTANESTGIIRVNKNNIGVYSLNSRFENKGTGLLSVENTTAAQNIGIYAVTSNDAAADNFLITNSGTIEVNGLKNIGIYSEIKDTANAGDTGHINLSSGRINVTASDPLTDSNIPLGVYAKGQNINVSSVSSVTKVSENGIGIYVDGASTLGNSVNAFNGGFTLKSTALSTPAIGAYLKNGAQALAGNITVLSTGTATDGSGNPLRPIGVFYAENTGALNNGVNITLTNDGINLNKETIGVYAEKVNSLTNTGNITISANSKGIGGYFKDTNLVNSGAVTVNADSAYGLYLKSDGITATNSSNAGLINVNSKEAVGIILDDKAKLTNTSTINSTAGGNAAQNGSMGVYVTNQGNFINDTTGHINATIAAAGTNPGSVGIYIKNGLAENKGNITSNYVGLYAEKDSSLASSSTIADHTGIITINNGIGIYAKDTGTQINLNAGGTINGTANNLSGVMAYDKAGVLLNGTNISLTGDQSNAIILGNSALNTDKSVLELKSGDITVGKEGTAIYSMNGNINIDSSYTGLITLGEKGTGVYADKDTAISAGTLETAYSHGSNKGVGIFYDGGTQENKVTIKQHAGNNNLINIYAQDITLVNNADQEVSQNGIGIFVKGPVSTTTVENKKLLSLAGSNSVGIVTEAGSAVTGIGKIAGINGKHDKIGVYVNGGDISGSAGYEFDIDGGIGIYLKNAVSYTGTMELKGGVYDDSLNKYRAIGILASSSFGTGTITAGIDMTGSGGIGIYQESGTDITYSGKLDLKGTSTAADQGIGVYTKAGSQFNLTAGGEIKIGGTNNIGFYVESGGVLNVAGGTVTNTEDGIFAYLEGGNMTFTGGGTNINYANVIVASGGSLVNQTTIATGKTGLQATGESLALVPSTILNDTTGIINSTTLNAVAMTGLDKAYIENKGKINLSGDGSIGMYVKDADGITTGEVNIGEKSVAYYADGINGEMTVNGISSIGKNSTLLAVANGAKINYQIGAISLGDERYGALIDGAASVIDFGGNNITTGNKSVAIMLQNGGQLNNTLHDITVGNEAVGIYLADFTNVVSPLSRTINLGIGSTGIYGENGGNIKLDGSIISAAYGAKGIASKNSAVTWIENSGTIDLSGAASVGMYGEGIAQLKNSSGKIIKIGDGDSANSKSGVGIFGLNSDNIINEGIIEFGNEAVGIYGENITSLIENKAGGLLTNNGGQKGTGIFAKGSMVENRGTIVLGDTSNGIYSDNGLVNNYNNITVGNDKSAGIFTSGTADINHISGTVSAGSDSVILASESGNIINNSTLLSTGEGTTYIYSKAGNGTTNTALTLTDYSVGMYGQSGIMTNNSVITVGKSDVAAGKFSVGMATETGKIVNSPGALITVGNEAGVGMFASGVEVKHPDGTITFGPSGRAENYGTIDVTGLKAYGMLGTNGATVYNDVNGIINVDGTGAKGIVGTNEAHLINDGIINVNGSNAQGVYIEKGATLTNTGQINVNGAGRIGVFVGMGSSFVNTAGITISSGGTVVLDGGGTLANIGDIVIDGPTATINGITINNTGKIEITGTVNFTDNILLETTPGKTGTINVGGISGTGHIILSPGATLGNNYDMYHVQLLGGLHNPTTETIRLTSQSVSFLAEKYFDKDLNSYVLTLTRIPYAQMLK